MNYEDINLQIDEILNGKRDLPQFNQPEHAGVCSAGSLLIGALIVCHNTRESLSAGGNAPDRKGTVPSNWQIDEAQEKAVQQWAEANGVWIPEAEQWLKENFGQKIAQGAEAIVYYKTGNLAVVKARTSIYATLERAFEAIALHNALFPETIMRVIGFTRDQDGLFRVLLTQPYIECQRLATKAEIDEMVSIKGFNNNGDGNGVNYVSERLHLEDMHPANIFVEPLTRHPICIDCIVKFRR